MMSASTRSTSLRDARQRLDRRRRHHAVGEHRSGQRLEVVGQHVVAAVGQRRGAGRVSPGQLAARRHAQRQVRRPPRLARDRDDVVGQLGRQVHALGGFLQRAHLGHGQHGLEARRARPRGARTTRAGCAARPRAMGSRCGCAAGSGPSATRAAGRCRSVPRRSGSPSPGTAASSGYVRPSTDTWPSFIASSSALCVRGGVRLISSARTRFANTGPGRNSNSPDFGSRIDTPTTSEGSRSLVNCTRWKVPPIDRASARASVVLPTPGTSSISRWPRASRATTAWRIAPGLPRSTRAMLASSAATQVRRRGETLAWHGRRAHGLATITPPPRTRRRGWLRRAKTSILETL